MFKYKSKLYQIVFVTSLEKNGMVLLGDLIIITFYGNQIAKIFENDMMTLINEPTRINLNT